MGYRFERVIDFAMTRFSHHYIPSEEKRYLKRWVVLFCSTYVLNFIHVSRFTDNQRSQDAMNLTFYHWGLHGWINYVTVGLTMAFVSYRKGEYAHTKPTNFVLHKTVILPRGGL